MDKNTKEETIKKAASNGVSVNGSGKANSERLKVLKTYKLYIDGKFPRTESGHYFVFKDGQGKNVANMCHGSRKDFRDAVVAARKAQQGWADKSAYNRGQILYRMAEVLEGRSEQFVAELQWSGLSAREASLQVEQSIDRLIHYAGWTDKFIQLFSSVNPVESSHFNFSVPEPTGVVAAIAPPASGLLGLISVIAPIIAGGNTCVVLAPEGAPAPAISFAEVLHSSDLPAGVVNLITGFEKELAGHFSLHMDVNAVWYCGNVAEHAKLVQTNAADNVKRAIITKDIKWNSAQGQSPYFIMKFQEIKTTWHPIGF